jgi:hypothetical protein
MVQSVEEVANAVAELKNLQEAHYEDQEKPLEVPAEIMQLAEYCRRRPSERAGVLLHLPYLGFGLFA